MANIADHAKSSDGQLSFICDFSPPRGGDAVLLDGATALDPDFVSIAYNPGRSVRVNSVAVAAWIKSSMSQDVVFTLATRDMNLIAIQSLLLGAQLLGLENVVVVQGDPLMNRDRERLSAVNDVRPAELIALIQDLNLGVDFRGLKLRQPTKFCVGATIDLSRGLGAEVALTGRKVEAGAEFFLAQPTFDAQMSQRLFDGYAREYGEDLAAPVFHGVQIMSVDGVRFADIPTWVTDDLDAGRSGDDIALQAVREYVDAGFTNLYIIPPILRGGRRDYDAAARVMAAAREGLG